LRHPRAAVGGPRVNRPAEVPDQTIARARLCELICSRCATATG